MLAANVPVVLLGHGFSTRLPITAIHYGTALLFLATGALFLVRVALA